jgi:hypothetical protein
LERGITVLEAKERPLALRGWQDDFFGDQLKDEYTPQATGAGSSVALVDGAHGGWVRLISGPVGGRSGRLWLGDAADGFDTLDADEGWTQIVRMKLNDVSDQTTVFGTGNAGNNRYIRAGLRTASSANWMVQTNDGVATVTASSVAADTNWHIHRLEVYPITGGGRQVDYFVDGVELLSKTTNVPTDIISPFVLIVSVIAASEQVDVDSWKVLPKNIT